MEERLSVRIEADIKNFQQGMSQVENNLKRAEGIFQSSSRSAFQLENAIAQLSREFKEGAVSRNQYNAQLAHLNSELTKQRSNVSASAREIDRLNKLMSAQQIQKVATANNQASKSFQGLATNVRGSNTVAMEFNRIIQDAPFGMMGVGNNIQQLSANFSNLSKNAGGTVPAIKAAFSAMVTGPNLALLAISALTAGITAYNMGAFDFISANKEKKKSLEDLQKELDEYRATLSTVQQQSIVGDQNAQQELATLDALAAQARNTALSNEQRTAAVEELQKKYPSYLGNLTDEQIKTGDVSEEMSKLRTNLIETAKAYAMIDKVRENSIALLDLEARALTRAQEIQAELARIPEARGRDDTRRDALAGRGGAAMAVLSEEQRIRQNINSLLEEQAADAEQINKLNQENLSLQERTNQALANGGNLVNNIANGLGKVVDHAGDLNFKELANIQESFALDEGKLEKDFANLIKNFQEKIAKDDTSFVNVPVKLDFTPETLSSDAQEQNDAIVEQWKERMKTIEQFGGQLQNTLAGAFEQSMLTGDDFFKSFAEGFKKMLAQMAAQLAASAVIKFLGFIVGGPAGGALAAGGGGSMLGSLFGGAAMRIGHTPSIGSPTGGSSSAGYRVDVNVHGVLRGNDIHVANQRNNREFGRYY